MPLAALSVDNVGDFTPSPRAPSLWDGATHTQGASSILIQTSLKGNRSVFTWSVSPR